VKGVGFYEEFEADGQPIGSVVAVFTDLSVVYRGMVQYDALGALYAEADSHVAGTSIRGDFLDTYRYQPITEERAREIHPRLFERLDSDD